MGQSGVGKSSLIERLVPSVSIRIGELGGNFFSVIEFCICSYSQSVMYSHFPYLSYAHDVGVGGNTGAHTTSNARLYHLPPVIQKRSKEKYGVDDFIDGAEFSDGGRIIDSPGIRELGIWHLSAESIKAGKHHAVDYLNLYVYCVHCFLYLCFSWLFTGFVEIEQYATQCKYRNCAHTVGEEGLGGCAVREALNNGQIHPDRLESYFTLMK